MNSHELRHCNQCDLDKLHTEFAPTKSGKHKGGMCKTCKYSLRYKREAIDPAMVQKNHDRKVRWRDANRGVYLEKKKVYGEYYRAKRLGKTVEERRAEQESARLAKIEAEEQAKRDLAAKREAERIARKANKPWLADGLTSGERWTLRYRNDPDFNLKQRFRSQSRKKHRTGRFGEMLRQSLKSNAKSQSILNQAGYTVAELRAHLESLFTEGMTWEIFLTGAIHIDHKIPLAAIENHLTDETQFRAAWSLSNLQPLWRDDNLRKGAKWDGDASPLISGDWRDDHIECVDSSVAAEGSAMVA